MALARILNDDGFDFGPARQRPPRLETLEGSTTVMLNGQSHGAESGAIAMFATHALAEAAVRKLASAHHDVRNITVVGRGFFPEERVQGFYNLRDRVGFWGASGAPWGGMWGLLSGGLFLNVPALGPLVVVGHLSTVVVEAVDGAVVVGGMSAIGAALYSVGIPAESVLAYERAMKADGFLVLAHGTSSEVERAGLILQQTQPSELDVHDGLTTSTAR